MFFSTLSHRQTGCAGRWVLFGNAGALAGRDLLAALAGLTGASDQAFRLGADRQDKRHFGEGVQALKLGPDRPY
jgi:hypothetical protein